MNNIFSILIIVLSYSLSAQGLTLDLDQLNPPRPIGFSIIKDSVDENLDEGKCLVHGTVKNTYGNAGINGIISTEGYKNKTKINPNGSFSLLVSSQDSIIYMYSEYFKEIIIKHKFQSQHNVEISITTKSQIMKVVPAKPVIYLYSETKKKVELNLQPKGGFLFSYPKHNKGWVVQTDTKGNIIHEKKIYPYIFWEGKKQKVNFNIDKEKDGLEGFFIKTDSAILFLERKLQILGLNEREITDFITYWGPKLIKTPYAFLQFMEQDEYASDIATLSINPKPESIQRVFMIFQGLNTTGQFKNAIVTPQKLTPFARKGFTLIEWGGAELNNLTLNL